MKRLWKIIFALSLAFLLAACGGESAPETLPPETAAPETQLPAETEAPVPTETLPDETEPVAVEVTIELSHTEDAMVWGLVSGLDQKGETLWTYTTGTYYVAQLDSIVGMELRNGLYYLVEHGSVTALDARDGSVVWTNSGFGGSPAQDCWAFDEAGNLYISGYLGPDLMVISPEGETLVEASTMSFDYFWPYELWLEGNAVYLTMEGTPDMDGEPATLKITLEEGTFNILSCEVEGQSVRMPMTAAATSILVESDVTHVPGRIIDGDMNTAWVEGEPGQGEGESVTILLGGETELTGFTIWGGYQKTERLYDRNSRPREITLTFSNGESQMFALSDVRDGQTITLSETVITQSVTITIDSVYPGSVYEDTCITEISFY